MEQQYDGLLREADGFLNEPAVSIKEEGGGNAYGQNGMDSGRRASDMMQTPALAYVLSGKPAYADKAVDCIHTWCAEPETRFDTKTYWGGAH